MKIVPHVGPQETRDWSEVIALMASENYELVKKGDRWYLELIVSEEEMYQITVPNDQIEALQNESELIAFNEEQARLI